MIWTGCKSSSQPHKIESAGRRCMEGACDDARDWVPRSSWHPRSNIRPHLGCLHEGQLDRCRMRCARSNEESLCLEPVLSPESTLCVTVPAGENLVCCASLPTTHVNAQQLTTICSWFIWQGATFRVPVTTLQRPKHEGCWDLPNLEVKCNAGSRF